MCSSIPACDLSELEGLDISQKKQLRKQRPSISIIIAFGIDTHFKKCLPEI